MSDENPAPSIPARTLTGDEIARRTFAKVRRGFDPHEVRAFLERVGAEVDRSAEHEGELRQRLADAQRRHVSPEADEMALAASLGQGTARILQSAHDAAAELLAQAERDKAAVMEEATEQAGRVLQAAEAVLADRTAAAEGADSELRRVAAADAEATLRQAREHRAEILSDLARRRRVLNTQVEQLNAGRETLMDILREGQRTLDHMLESIGQAETGARRAAEAAARRVAVEADPTPREMARMLDEAAEGAGRSFRPTVDEATDAEEPALPAEAPEPALPAEAPSPEPALPAEAPSPEEALPEEAPSPEPALPAEAPSPEPALPAEAPSPEPALPAEAPSPEPALPAESPEPAPSGAVPPDEPVEVTEGAGPSAPVARPDVDALFARIRAGRAEEVAKAERILHAELAPEQPPLTEDEVPHSEASQLVIQSDGDSDDSSPGSDHQPGSSGPDQHLVEARTAIIGPITGRLARRLKLTLQDEHNEVLDRLRVQALAGKRPGGEVSDGGLPDGNALPTRAEQERRYRDAAVESLREAAQAGAELVADPAWRGVASTDVGPPAPDLPAVNPEGGARVEDLAEGLADAVVGPLRRQLERVLAESSGDDPSVVIERAGAAYREWKGGRTEAAAGDAAVAAFARGGLAAVPVGTPLRWLVHDGGGDCPDCDDNALAGPVPAGESYPTGQVHPPAHAGCRCLLVPQSSGPAGQAKQPLVSAPPRPG